MQKHYADLIGRHVRVVGRNTIRLVHAHHLIFVAEPQKVAYVFDLAVYDGRALLVQYSRALIDAALGPHWGAVQLHLHALTFILYFVTFASLLHGCADLHGLQARATQLVSLVHRSSIHGHLGRLHLEVASEAALQRLLLLLLEGVERADTGQAAAAVLLDGLVGAVARSASTRSNAYVSSREHLLAGVRVESQRELAHLCRHVVRRAARPVLVSWALLTVLASRALVAPVRHQVTKRLGVVGDWRELWRSCSSVDEADISLNLLPGT